MTSTRTIWIVVGIVVLVVLGYVGAKYNSLVKQNVAIDAQWAQVESQYQRRFDLIPNLVSSVQGAMKQEQSVFTELADARSKYAGATTPEDKASAASEVETGFGRLLAIMENYPQLKSIDAVQSLMAELAGTENRVAVERMRYNEVVREYDTSIQTFPGSLIANMFAFKMRTMFEAATGAEIVPKVTL